MLIITKSDLVPHFDFDIEKIKKDAIALNPSLKVLVTSAKTGEGLDEWFEFLNQELRK
jgi:hydrogenase nickel incorporation protein HypB